jgi:hypothetical protein
VTARLAGIGIHTVGTMSVVVGVVGLVRLTPRDAAEPPR